jgi:hypothetical protein
MSSSLDMLLLGRVLLGLVGGPIMPLSQMLLRVFPRADLRLRRACDGAPLPMIPACRERIAQAQAQAPDAPEPLRAVG